MTLNSLYGLRHGACGASLGMTQIYQCWPTCSWANIVTPLCPVLHHSNVTLQQKADLQHEEGYLAYVISDELLPATPIEGLQVGPPAQGIMG